MNQIIAIIIILAVLLLWGMPISLALLGATIGALVVMGGPLSIIPQSLFQSVMSFPLMALPFFVMLANVLAEGGAVEPLVNLTDAFLGRVRGAVALATIFAGVIFAALVGSSVASAMAFGRVTIPMMRKLGYPEPFALAVPCVGGTLAILIPPSLLMIMYSSLANTSISDLFIAGVLPGLLLTVVLAGTTFLLAIRYRLAKSTSKSWRERGLRLRRAIPILIVPVIIIGGIYAGVATPTETAAVSTAYCILVVVLYYKVSWSKIIPICGKSFLGAAMVMFIMAAALTFGRVIAMAGLPQLISNFLLKLNLTPVLFLLCFNILFLALGTIFEGTTLTFVFLPLLIPAAAALGINLVHLGIIWVVNIEIAMLTPPVAVNLFAISRVANAPISTVVRGVMPYYLGFLIFLGVVTYWPTLSLWLPSTMMHR